MTNSAIFFFFFLQCFSSNFNNSTFLSFIYFLFFIFFSVTFARKFLMMRSSSPPEADESGGGGIGLHSIRDRFPLKRNPVYNRDRAKVGSDRSGLLRSRSHPTRFNRKGLPWLKAKSAFCFIMVAAVIFFVVAVFLPSSITPVFRQGSERVRLIKEGLRFGSTLKFLPPRVSRSDGLDSLRSEPRIGVRSPRLALVSFFSFFLS